MEVRPRGSDVARPPRRDLGRTVRLVEVGQRILDGPVDRQDAVPRRQVQDRPGLRGRAGDPEIATGPPRPPEATADGRGAAGVDEAALPQVEPEPGSRLLHYRQEV